VGYITLTHSVNLSQPVIHKQWHTLLSEHMIELLCDIDELLCDDVTGHRELSHMSSVNCTSNIKRNM